MVVLLLFNDAEQLSYQELEQATRIPEGELKRVLQSLACVKVCELHLVAAPAFLLVPARNSCPYQGPRVWQEVGWPGWW